MMKTIINISIDISYKNAKGIKNLSNTSNNAPRSSIDISDKNFDGIKNLSNVYLILLQD
jgi:hypothetical protein